jgi:hypothetical protein
MTPSLFDFTTPRLLFFHPPIWRSFLLRSLRSYEGRCEVRILAMQAWFESILVDPGCVQRASRSQVAALGIPAHDWPKPLTEQ